MSRRSAESYAGRRARERAERAQRAASHVAQPVDAGSVPDPMRPRPSRAARWVGWMVAAVILHVVTAGVFVGVSAAMSQLGDRRDLDADRVEIQIVEVRPPEPEPEPEPEVVEPEPEPEPEAPPQPEPPKPKPPPREPPPEPTPSADPIDPPPTPPEPKEPPPRRIVGLNLESTVEGGAGSSFAIGNTRMGKTDEVAEDPNAAKTLPKGEPAQRGQNQSATRIPALTSGSGSGRGVSKPKPLSRPEPEYPPMYESQGLEADVVVKVTLNEEGRVTEASVVTPSPHEKFNENALASARKTRFTPATKDGKPIPWTLTYTVRFRLPE